MWLSYWTLLPKAHVTRDIFADNIAIKYILEPWISMTNQGKLLTNIEYLDVWFFKSLPWLLNRNLLTEIKISFYRNIVCQNVSCE